MCARGTSSASSRAAIESARPGNVSEAAGAASPYPGMSQAMHRKWSDSPSSCGSQARRVPPSPWRKTIGGPSPASRHDSPPSEVISGERRHSAGDPRRHTSEYGLDEGRQRQADDRPADDVGWVVDPHVGAADADDRRHADPQRRPAAAVPGDQRSAAAKAAALACPLGKRRRARRANVAAGVAGRRWAAARRNRRLTPWLTIRLSSAERGRQRDHLVGAAPEQPACHRGARARSG